MERRSNSSTPNSETMSTLRRIAQVSIFFVFLLSCLEIAARVDDRVSTGTPILSSPDPTDLQIDDGAAIYGRPYAQYRQWRLNSLGMQGPETVEHKPSGTMRVVVLGASETFGSYESPGMTYADQLQKL